MAFLVQSRLRHSSSIHSWPNLHTTMDYSDTQGISVKFSYHNSRLKCFTIPLAVSSYIAKQHPLIEVADEASEAKDTETHSGTIFYHNEGPSESREVNGHDFEDVVSCSMEELKETLRRRRIGMANKGKVPWNKGRKHTPETCARIKERTLEAMSDPKIRRKMSEAPRTHSEQSKKKIGSSLKQLWAKRLKLKRSKEKFYFSWVDSLAEAARKGGIDEDNLNWDSYEKLKKEIACRKHADDEEKAKEKVEQRIQALNKKTQEKAQSLARVKKFRDKNTPRAKKKLTRKKNEEEGGSSKVRVKSKLTKVEENKSIDGPSRTQSGVMSNLHSALEKFDIESIKEEQKRKTISLADQIQAAKSRRMRLSKPGSSIDTLP